MTGYAMSKLHHSFILTALAVATQIAAAQTAFNPTVGEYNWSTTVNQLGMRNIHARGILGQGVIVGLLDTGINLSNPEFRNNSHVLAGYNVVDGSTDVTDTIGHGTHVAGIVGAPGNATGMYGVAPEASLLMVKIFSGNTASSTNINRGIDYAVSRGARVINMSLGAPSPTGEYSLRQAAATNNTVIVVAAGNESMSTPSWPARYAKEPWANGTMIAVGAVDSNKRLASFSNKAGDTAMYYLVAPGVNIISSYSTGYAYLSGTSMATPAVSGAAALITGYWPYLRANQVAAILLNTADDLGAPGVDSVYGHGMLNVNRALSPVGSYTYRKMQGSRITVALSTPGVASSQPHVSTPSAFGGLTTQVFDEYGRNFTSDEGQALAVHSVMTVDSVLGKPDRMLDAAEQIMRNGGRLMRLQSRITDVQHLDHTKPVGVSGEPWNHIPQSDASMVTMQMPSGHALSAGDGGMASMSLGLLATPMASRLNGVENILANPLLGFAPNHQFASMSVPLSEHWSSRVGVAHSKAYDAPCGDVNLAELSYATSSSALNFSAAHLIEQGLLGGYSKSVLGLNQQTATTGLSLSGALALSAQWTLTGAFNRTSTGAPSASGLLMAATAIQSQSYGVGVVHADNWRDGDRLSLSVNAPLRARTGTLTYDVVTGVTDTGEPIYGTHTVNLAANAQEWTTEARYSTRLSQTASVSAVAAWRVHPDHDASAPSQLALGVRYSLAF
jgi:hypothetical protein